MKTIVRNAIPALLVAAALSTSAWAQTPASSTTAKPVAPGAAAAARHAEKHQDFVDQRLNEMHARLKITSEQSSQWDAFAQTMRDSAEKTDQAYKDRAEKLSGLNADDAMKSYASLAQLHADNTQKLASAFSTLYASLSDAQKKTADVMFREQQHKREAMQRKHKRAAPAAAASAAAPAPASN